MPHSVVEAWEVRGPTLEQSEEAMCAAVFAVVH